MASSILMGNSGSNLTTLFNGESQSQRLVNTKLPSSNRHDVSIKWLDTKMDPNDIRTQQLLIQLNDRVELFNDTHECLNYLYECCETILLIISGKCAIEYLRSIHPISSIDSIIIYCANPEKYRHLTNDNYNKILTCIATESELIQCVHNWIDLKCQTHLYIWINEMNESKQLTRQTSLFLANHLLPNCINYEAYGTHKQEMLRLCRLYYSQRPSEFDYIREFELTYTSADAIKWYTRDSFVHKIVNRTLRSFDHVRLSAISFYIRDLREQLRECFLKMNSKEISMVYHGLIMTQNDINRIEDIPNGSLISTNGFLSTSQKRDVALAFATKKQNIINESLHNVLLKINLDIKNSPVIYANVGHISVFPEEYEVLFDIKTILRLETIEYDEEKEFYIIKLSIATENDYKSIDNLIKQVRYQLDEQIDHGGEKSFIGKLLNIYHKDNEQTKKNDDHLQKFSLLRSTFRNLWYSNHDKLKQLIEENQQWIVKLYKNYRQFRNNHKITLGNKYNLNAYTEPSLARFEPVLFFCFDDEFLQDEKPNLSSIFELQYRRFITKRLTSIEVEENLNEFYFIYYISSELPSHMMNNRRIKFYELKLHTENKDSKQKMKEMGRMIERILYDLGVFYSEQAENLAKEKEEEEDRIITKGLLAKGAKCYQKLADQNEKTIQRYTMLNSNNA